MYHASGHQETDGCFYESSFGEDLQRFVGQCQVLCAVVSARERPLRDIAESLSAALPRPRCSADFLMLRSIVVEFATRATERTATGGMDALLPLVCLKPSDEPLGQVLVRCLSAMPIGAQDTNQEGSVQALRANQASSAIVTRCAEPDLDAAAIAFEVHVSQRCLGKLLHEHFGLGFRTALRQARVTAARRLLEQSTYSIKEIAAHVGYSWTSQFDRDFRAVCGVTPGQYRVAHCNGDEHSARQLVNH